MDFDLAIVGSGPAGATCATLCAQAGMRIVLLDREAFPREKVCGDCLNPRVWPILYRLGVAEQVRALAHAPLREVQFRGENGADVRIPLHEEIAVKRNAFDHVLRERAARAGADLRECALLGLDGSGRLETSTGHITARFVVAADGRNSTVARLLGLLPSPARDRVALQAHIDAAAEMRERVTMQFHPEGYSGLADVGEGVANLCLVARPAGIDAMKSRAQSALGLDPAHPWRSVTTLTRRGIFPLHGTTLFVGDAARVLEPFTGEGIYFALASGQLAAQHLFADDLPGYAAAHARLYRGRTWINHLARFACLHPQAASWLIRWSESQPRLLQYLTARVIA